MPTYNERRQTIRVTTNGTMTVECLSPGPSLWLVDVGMGGFCARSASPMPINTIANYRFATADGKWHGIFRAKTVHSRAEAPEGKSTKSFLNGFCFVNIESAAVQGQLGVMIDQATHSVSFS